MQCVNVYFMKALLAGTKKALKTEAVKVLYAPQYESLAISKLLDFVAGYNAITDYLPDPRDMPSIPRQVSISILFILIKFN